MALFDIDDPNAHVGYRNLRAAKFPQEQAIKDGLEHLWLRYKPYADTNFCAEFARHPDERFWEMYLAIRFLDARKKMRKREELTAAQRDTGPDICIRKGRRRIWIEGIATGAGNADNLDQVPDLFAANADEIHDAPRRQIELRITTALQRKAKKFEGYRKSGIVGEKDSYVIAISGGQFALEAAGAGLPHAVTAVYPFGEEFAVVDRETAEFVALGHKFSAEIRKARGRPEPRTAFQHKMFSSISGIIWSLRSIGNFLGQSDDFVFVHNQMAERPIPRQWINWDAEYFPIEDGKKLRKKIRRR
jgi:hypothetical protein